MAAPSGTYWSGNSSSTYRLGFYFTKTHTDTQTTVTTEVWFQSKGYLNDDYNKYYFDINSTSATTLRSQNIAISHTSSSNQTKLGSYTYTHDKYSTERKIYCSAKLALIGSNDSTVTYSTYYTVPVLDSYTVSYNANGGSGAPSSQTKYHSISITLSKSVPTKTGYSFLGWSTSSTATSATYSAGDTYSANATATLYAVWKANTYTVSYDANGGSGAPANQTKTYGVALTLSSTIPTRTNYNFLGWGTSASSTTVSYSAGESYTNNAAITLYAIWELAYTEPRIYDWSLFRSDSEGTLSDDGTCFTISFNWETDKEASSIIVWWKLASSSTWPESQMAYFSTSGISGSFSQIFDSVNISTETSYDVCVRVNDSIGKIDIYRTVPGKVYPIDVLNGGKGVAIGKPAEREGFDVEFNTYINGTLSVNDIPVTGNSLQYKGRQLISSVSDDTTTNWISQDNSVHYYYTSGLLTDQPNQYGILLNYICSSEVHQLWLSQSSGSLFHRGGNHNGWTGTWRTLLDSYNYTSYCAKASHTHSYLPLSGGTVTGNTIFESYVICENTVNTIGQFRMHTDWIGFYQNVTEAQNNGSYKAWIGLNGTTNFYVATAEGSLIANKQWTINSDKRLKKNIENAPDALIDIWNELQPKLFEWNYDQNSDGAKHLGLIAQDVISVFEKYGLNYEDYGFVNSSKLMNDDTEYFGVTYDFYHMMTSMVLRDTKSKLDAQQKQIDGLQSQIDELKSIIAKLT